MMEARKNMPWIALAVGVLLLGYPYAFVFRRLAEQWMTDPEMAHAVLVPGAIGLLVWRRWSTVKLNEAKPSWWGLVVLAIGTVGYAAAVWGGGLFLGTVAGLFSGLGLLVLTLGLEMVREFAAPLSLAVFGLPRLAVVYDAVTNPMQQVSASLATAGLRGLDVVATNVGGLITVAGYPVLLAESCSGLRFLVPLLFLGAVVWQLGGLRWRAGIGLLAAAVPLAVMANALRVGVLVYLAGTHGGVPPEAVHEWLGYPLYAGALGTMLFLVKRMRDATA
jgi:exosortase